MFDVYLLIRMLYLVVKLIHIFLYVVASVLLLFLGEMVPKLSMFALVLSLVVTS